VRNAAHHGNDTEIDVLFLNWRDRSHPEGGGSETYVHRVAEGLATRGLRVTLFCAAHDRAEADEIVAGVRTVRRGGRFGVYPRGMAYALRQRPRLVVDVQNGIPFASPLVTRAPVVVLLHHVHREQWPILFGRLLGAVGWLVESRFAPWVYRNCRYVTVSAATADELSGLGIARERITVVPNGVDPGPPVATARSARPRLVTVGRLVPHKRVEHAIDVLARLRHRWPDLSLDVVGKGWWGDRLRAYARERGVDDAVRFHGFLDERAKHELLAQAWVHVCPSVKEGWGLVVTEAAGHRVPTVAYRSAGGLRESVLDGRTGTLVDDLDAMVAEVDRLLGDATARATLGAAAQRRAAEFTWEATTRAFGEVLAETMASASAHRSGTPVPIGPSRSPAVNAREGAHPS
jgi:glycosyltransferase involved in cell wall biosynthesis